MNTFSNTPSVSSVVIPVAAQNRQRRNGFNNVTPITSESEVIGGLAIRYADAAPDRIGKEDVRKVFEFRNKGVLIYIRALTKKWQTLIFASINGAPTEWMEINEARSKDTANVVPHEILYNLDKLEADRPVLVLDQSYIFDADMIQSRLGDGYVVVSASKNADLSPLNGRDVILFGDDAFLENVGNKLLKSAKECRNLDIHPTVFKSIQNADEMLKHVVKYAQRYEVEPVDGYIQKKDGLYIVDENYEGEALSETKISSPFNILPNIEILEEEGVNNSYKKRIQFTNMMNNKEEKVIETINIGTKKEILDEIGRLRKAGMTISTEDEGKLAAYLSLVNIKAPPVVGVKKFGWAEIDGRWAFILPNQVISSGGSIEVTNMSKVAPKISSKGTLSDMKTLFNLCWQNKRLVFAISNAFAAPIITILPHLFRNLGGYNFAGKTSSGKTTLLAASAAMWGCGTTDEKIGIIKSCSATVNGMENTAEAANDTFLALDELGKMPPRAVAELPYLIGNGEGKTRMARDGSARETKTWNTTFIATGEKTFEEIMLQAGIPAKGGQILRFTDLDANAGAFGVFDDCAGMTPAEFSQEIKRLSETFYGTPAITFLQRLVDDRNAGVLETKVMELYNDVIRYFAHDPQNGELERLNNKFALTAIAGELAIEYGIMNWPKTTCAVAVTEVYKEYLQSSGLFEKGSDEKMIFKAFADFIDKYTASSSIPHINGKRNYDGDEEYQRTGSEGMLGVYREGTSHERDDVDYSLFTATVDQICSDNGLNMKLVKKVLKEKKILQSASVVQVKLDNGRKSVRCWTLNYKKLLAASGVNFNEEYEE